MSKSLRFITAASTSALAIAASPAVRAADLKAINNAAQIASSVGVGTSTPALGLATLLQTLIGTAIVVALVFGCAWVTRRLGLHQGGRGGRLIRTIGATSLGGKERVAVVEIGDTWLVLGTAPGNVRLLHTMGAQSRGDVSNSNPADGSATDVASSRPFKQRLLDVLQGDTLSRYRASEGQDS